MILPKPISFKINEGVYITPSGIRIKFKREPDFDFWRYEGSWKVEQFLGMIELIDGHNSTREELNRMAIMTWKTILHAAQNYYKR